MTYKAIKKMTVDELREFYPNYYKKKKIQMSVITIQKNENGDLRIVCRVRFWLWVLMMPVAILMIPVVSLIDGAREVKPFLKSYFSHYSENGDYRRDVLKLNDDRSIAFAKKYLSKYPELLI